MSDSSELLEAVLVPLRFLLSGGEAVAVSQLGLVELPTPTAKVSQSVRWFTLPCWRQEPVF